MSDRAEYAPNLHRVVALTGLAAASTAYALTLNTRVGRRWAAEQTWSTVVAGVALTTAFVAVENRKAAQLSLIYFIVAGVPMIIRSLWLQIEQFDRIANRERHKGC